ncbi:MAG TPA: aminotransferase class I/II-fold pyridoxal phosphate-dependent enzyme [Actinomycetota bacterium]|nr:aminotransferase class I/II-fold pyridoxal phosphate-dependent enzyme [Actinomycetota bacterium]
MGGPGKRRFQTRAVHTHRAPPPEQRSSSVPIFQSSTFRFETNEEFARAIRFDGPGYVYSRGYGNPTVDAFQSAMADLEGTESAIGFASGMAAISSLFLTVAGSGSRIVAGTALYGGTVSMLRTVLPRFGVETTFVDPTDLDAVRAALPGADLFYCETIVNPTTAVADLAALADLCRDAGVISAVDNTFASPYLCNPAGLGFDVVLHSATKYIGGHADLIGGVACTSEELFERLRGTVIDVGGAMPPLEAWLCLRGLATLSLRMEHHCASAARLASALEAHPAVSRVHYPGLPSHPQHGLARRQLRNFGGTLAFEVTGGLEAGSRVAEALELGWIGGSLGSVMTLVAHPASTTHRQVDPEAREAAGIGDGLLRVAVGLEDPDDLVEDFTRALEKA